MDYINMKCERLGPLVERKLKGLNKDLEKKSEEETAMEEVIIEEVEMIEGDTRNEYWKTFEN